MIMRRSEILSEYYLSLARVVETEFSDDSVCNPRRRLFHVGFIAEVSAQSTLDYRQINCLLLWKPMSQCRNTELPRALKVPVLRAVHLYIGGAGIRRNMHMDKDNEIRYS